MKKIIVLLFLCVISLFWIFKLFADSNLESYSTKMGLNVSPKTLSEELKATKELNIKDIRIPLAWETIQPTSDTWDWELIDNIVNSNPETNIILTIRAISDWGTTVATQNTQNYRSSSFPKDIKQRTSFIKNLATRYKDKNVIYEIENEVNWKAFWQSSQEEYITLLEESYKSIKSVDSDSIVLHSAMWCWITNDFTKEESLEILQKHNDFLLSIFETKAFDIINVHNYYFPTEPVVNWITFEKYLDNIKTLAKDSWIEYKAIWITESWYNVKPVSTQKRTDPWSPELQVNFFNKIYDYSAENWVKKIFWLILEDRDESYFWTMWLRDSQKQNRPIFDVIKDLAYKANDIEKKVVSNPIGISFPPVKNKEELEFTLSKLKDLWIDKIRFSTKWEDREPKKNKFNWSPLDERINFFYDNDISILLTINFDDLKYWDKNQFKNFIKTLAKRYSNKIDKIQYWNEWDYNNKDEIENFVEYNNVLFEEFKKHSPETEVVLWWLTRSSLVYKALCLENKVLDFSNLSLIDWKKENDLQNYLKNDVCIKNKEDSEKTYQIVDYVLKNAKYDLVDLHLYDDAENWDLYVKYLQDKVTKPIIVSEFWGPSPTFEVYSDEYQAVRVKDYVSTVQSLPIKEAYYFKLLDDDSSFHKNSWLISKDWKNEKPSYKPFKFSIALSPSIKYRLDGITKELTQKIDKKFSTQKEKSNFIRKFTIELHNLSKQKPKYRNMVNYFIYLLSKES